MQRYFFHLYDHLECRDEEGALLPDLKAVMKAAQVNARSLMAESVRGGELCLSHRIEVEDEAGRQTLVLTFGEAVCIRL